MSIQSVNSQQPPAFRAEVSTAARKTEALPRDPEGIKSSQPASLQQLETATKRVAEYVKPFNSGLQFSVDDDTKQVVVKVVDIQTKEVIRQIPSEEMMAMSKALDSLQGLLLRQKA